MRVTFCTSTFGDVVAPGEDPRWDPAACQKVHDALKANHLRHSFAESLVALDAITRAQKVDAIGSGRIVSSSEAIGPQAIILSVGAQWKLEPMHPLFEERLQRARELGMRALRGPVFIGVRLPMPDMGADFYHPDASVQEITARGDKANHVDAELAKRGIGRARAIRLGCEFSTRDGATGEWWPQGLGRARNKTEKRKAREAINEWADGEAIAAHIAYGNDLFCTQDEAKSAGSQSVFSSDHRKWLAKEFGILFVTVAELAERLPS